MIRATASDIEALRAALAVAEARAEEAVAKASNAEAIIAALKLMVEKLRREVYGQRSERKARLLDQLELELEELEARASEDELAAEQAAAKTSTVKSFTRRRPSRKPFPEHLPRERVVVPAPEVCGCCGSDRLSKLGEDITETLEVIPRSWKVVQTVREKFTCRDCEKISQAPAPFHVTPRGWAGPSLLAMILFEKYGQHQPLNRQSERYGREGVELSLSTLADQVGACTTVLRPLHDLIAAHGGVDRNLFEGLLSGIFLGRPSRGGVDRNARSTSSPTGSTCRPSRGGVDRNFFAVPVRLLWESRPTRQPTHGAPGPTHEVGLYLRCVPRAVSVRALSCPAATLRPCNGILMKSRPGDPGAHAVLLWEDPIQHHIVAPRVGAWIETRPRSSTLCIWTSPLAWGRGSKRLSECQGIKPLERDLLIVIDEMPRLGETLKHRPCRSHAVNVTMPTVLWLYVDAHCVFSLAGVPLEKRPFPSGQGSSSGCGSARAVGSERRHIVCHILALSEQN